VTRIQNEALHDQCALYTNVCGCPPEERLLRVLFHLLAHFRGWVGGAVVRWIWHAGPGEGKRPISSSLLGLLSRRVCFNQLPWSIDKPALKTNAIRHCLTLYRIICNITAIDENCNTKIGHEKVVGCSSETRWLVHQTITPKVTNRNRHAKTRLIPNLFAGAHYRRGELRAQLPTCLQNAQSTLSKSTTSRWPRTQYGKQPNRDNSAKYSMNPASTKPARSPERAFRTSPSSKTISPT
jgi:hypothetical protein